MRKNCPFCGAEMPEEANLCLTCFSMCFTKNETGSVRLRRFGKNTFRPKVKRRTERWVSSVLSVLLFSGVLLTAFSSLEKVPATPKTPNASAQTQGTDTAADANTNTASNLSTGAATDGTTVAGEPVRLSGMAESVFGKVTGLGIPSATTPAAGLDSTGTQTNPVLGTRPNTGATSNSQTNTGNSTSGNGTGGSNSVTTPQEPEPTEPEYDNFEYMSYDSKNDKITLIKYKGNSKKVLVPAVIDGKPVARIEENTFSDNSNIQEIIFESNPAQTFLWLVSGCMTNLTELKTVRMPDTDLGIYTEFAINCRKLADIDIDNSQYRFEDGALYYWSSRRWELRYYAPACKNETLTVASWCAGIDGACNLDENPYLKRIVLHKNVTMFPSNYKINDALEEVYVEPGNANGFSVDGVLFYKDNKGVYNGSLYPPSKKDKSFVMPENVTLNVYRYYCPYLEEIWIPASSGVNAPDTLYFRRCFTNLKVIYLQKGHSYETACRSTFTGKTEMY